VRAMQASPCQGCSRRSRPCRQCSSTCRHTAHTHSHKATPAAAAMLAWMPHTLPQQLAWMGTPHTGCQLAACQSDT
jgi:hypothetical protein